MYFEKQFYSSNIILSQGEQSACLNAIGYQTNSEQIHYGIYFLDAIRNTSATDFEVFLSFKFEHAINRKVIISLKINRLKEPKLHISNPQQK